jgi:hypothetical protein
VGGIVDALNREWRELGQGHQETARRWSARHRALVRCGSFDEILQAAWLDPDAVLGALLAEVASGDQLAARVVLQSMIGRMVQMALRDRRAGIDDYISALWCQIRTYPLSNRPQRIAANLSLDTLKAVSSERRWLKQGEVSTWPPESFLGEAFEALLMGGVAENEPLRADQVLRRGRRLDLIDDPTLSLLRGVYVEGLSGDAAARRHHTSAGTVRVRCGRAVARLAAHADQLVDVV